MQVRFLPRVFRKIKMSLELKQKIVLLKQIGEDIAARSQEAKNLRKEIAELVEELKLGKVNKDEPVTFVVGNLIVTVQKPQDEQQKDFVVLFKPITVFE